MPTAISSDKIYLSSEKDTEKLAGKISKKLTPGNIVFLYGEIGVGKTTFIRYLINRFQKDNKLKTGNVVYLNDKMGVKKKEVLAPNLYVEKYNKNNIKIKKIGNETIFNKLNK